MKITNKDLKREERARELVKKFEEAGKLKLFEGIFRLLSEADKQKVKEIAENREMGKWKKLRKLKKIFRKYGK